jgi:hypothetical protein
MRSTVRAGRSDLDATERERGAPASSLDYATAGTASGADIGMGAPTTTT